MQSSETAKNPRTTFQTPQASITMLNVEVHCSAIRRSLKKYALFGRVARRKPLVSQKNMQAWLQFTKLSLNKPLNFWDKVL